MKRLTAWSFSRWETYTKCPYFAKLRYFDRLPEPPPGRPLIRGSAIHLEAEKYLKAKRKPRKIPASLRFFEEDFAQLRKQRAVAEGKWGFDKNWKPTGFFDADIWCRMILDARVRLAKKTKAARVIDFKTGREYPKHEQQLELYALGGFSADLTLETITSEMWYLDSGDSWEVEFNREEHHKMLLGKWAERVEPMLSDTKFIATPSEDSCKWCPFKNGKGCDARA